MFVRKEVMLKSDSVLNKTGKFNFTKYLSGFIMCVLRFNASDKPVCIDGQKNFFFYEFESEKCILFK